MNKDKSQQWSELKERGDAFTLSLMLGIYRFGGRWLCHFILYFIILWYWLFSNAARQASLGYLTRLHQFAGDQSPFKTAPNWANSYRHLMQFGEGILDKIAGWLGHMPEHDLQLHGHEHFREYYNRGAIIVVSHFGNIELLRAIKSAHVQKINILVYQKHATKFNQLMKKINHKAGINLVSVDELGMDTALILQEKLDQGEWIVVAADRIPVQSQRMHRLEFLGEEADWPQGAWMLAHLLKVPVLAVFCYQAQQQYHVHIHLLSTALNFPRRGRDQAMRDVMREYIDLMQHYCLRAPYQWFNFYNFWNK